MYSVDNSRECSCKVNEKDEKRMHIVPFASREVHMKKARGIGEVIFNTCFAYVGGLGTELEASYYYYYYLGFHTV